MPKRGNAVATINSTFNSVTRDSRIQILLVAWLFSGFIEGAAGFGAAPALAAPILTGLGVPAMTAVCVALICNTLAVPFGAVGIPVITSFSTLAGSIGKTGLTEMQFYTNVINALTAISGASGPYFPHRGTAKCAVFLKYCLFRCLPERLTLSRRDTVRCCSGRNCPP